ncbi:MAG: WalW protein, partial [Candidatus Thorarchaeota archaeon]
MYLVVTVDTEEDNWDRYHIKKSSVSNIEKIPILQGLFAEYDVKPSYVITYPVASNETSVKILRNIYEDGRAEIGAHLHPWSTPPYDEESNAKNSMLCNLSSELQSKKIKVLHETIISNFKLMPTIFKAGRWAFNHAIANNISKLGYKIDISITPYVDWSYCHGPDYSIL